MFTREDYYESIYRWLVREDNQTTGLNDGVRSILAYVAVQAVQIELNRL